VKQDANFTTGSLGVVSLAVDNVAKCNQTNENNFLVLATTSLDNYIRIWSLEHSSLLHQIETPPRNFKLIF
jgi:hypothetical protein